MFATLSKATIGLAIAASAQAAPLRFFTRAPAPQTASTSTSSFALSNGLAAQALNAQFASLTASSPCSGSATTNSTTGPAQACIQGAFAQCVNGAYELSPCSSGTQCFALPLVNSAGTTVTCDTVADATARIAASGATGGVTSGAGNGTALENSTDVASSSTTVDPPVFSASPASSVSATASAFPSVLSSTVDFTTSSATSSAPASTGTQFITGICLADSDCASGCCDAVTALCAAKLVAEQNGHGCGFDGTPKASSPVSAIAASSTAPGSSSGKPPGTQFITGNCASDSECASGCCDAVKGLCAAQLVAQEDGDGCGFDGTPKASSPALASAPMSAPAASSTAPGSSSGKPPGTQFITGNCASDSECASGCCDAVKGLCAAQLVAQEDGDGCGFDGTPKAKAT